MAKKKAKAGVAQPPRTVARGVLIRLLFDTWMEEGIRTKAGSVVRTSQATAQWLVGNNKAESFERKSTFELESEVQSFALPKPRFRIPMGRREITPSGDPCEFLRLPNNKIAYL